MVQKMRGKKTAGPTDVCAIAVAETVLHHGDAAKKSPKPTRPEKPATQFGSNNA